MRLIAHRGFAAEASENTLSAVRAAATRADAVEVDARRCASGELVVIHDVTVDRVTDGTGRVADLDRAALASLSVLGSGEGVPVLSDVVAAIPDDVGLVLELKERGLASDALATVDDVGDVTVSAFDPAVILECRSVDATVPLALNVVGTSVVLPEDVSVDAADGIRVDAWVRHEDPSDDAGRPPDERVGSVPDDEPVGTGDEGAVDGIALARGLDCVAIHPHVGLGTAAYVRRAHEADLAVNAWTVEDRETARALDDAGFDGVIADRAVLP